MGYSGIWWDIVGFSGTQWDELDIVGYNVVITVFFIWNLCVNTVARVYANTAYLLYPCRL